MNNNIQENNDIISQTTQKNLFDRIYGERKDTLQKLLTIVSVIFFILVPIELILNVVSGFIYYESLPSNYLATEKTITLISYLLKAITAPAVPAFYGLVLAVLKRIISK